MGDMASICCFVCVCCVCVLVTSLSLSLSFINLCIYVQILFYEIYTPYDFFFCNKNHHLSSYYLLTKTYYSHLLSLNLTVSMSNKLMKKNFFFFANSNNSNQIFKENVFYTPYDFFLQQKPIFPPPPPPPNTN